MKFRDIDFTCPHCKKETYDDYMVKDEVWKAAGLTYRQNVHLRCLAEMLGRPLMPDDLTEVPVNEDVIL